MTEGPTSSNPQDTKGDEGNHAIVRRPHAGRQEKRDRDGKEDARQGQDQGRQVQSPPLLEQGARPLVVYDFFSGTGGMSEAFRVRGHRVVRIEKDVRFCAVPETRIGSVKEFPLPDDGDVWLGGPPCQGLGVPQIGPNWHHDNTPKALKGSKAWGLAEWFVLAAKAKRPRFWWMENPRAKLRRLMEIHHPDVPRVEISYCRYGDTAMKPTDLWGWWPATWKPRPMCNPGNPDHAPGARSTSGPGSTQGKTDAAARAAVPYALSLDFCLAVEGSI